MMGISSLTTSQKNSTGFRSGYSIWVQWTHFHVQETALNHWYKAGWIHDFMLFMPTYLTWPERFSRNKLLNQTTLSNLLLRFLTWHHTHIAWYFSAILDLIKPLIPQCGWLSLAPTNLLYSESLKSPFCPILMLTLNLSRLSWSFLNVKMHWVASMWYLC